MGFADFFLTGFVHGLPTIAAKAASIVAAQAISRKASSLLASGRQQEELGAFVATVSVFFARRGLFPGAADTPPLAGSVQRGFQVRFPTQRLSGAQAFGGFWTPDWFILATGLKGPKRQGPRLQLFSN